MARVLVGSWMVRYPLGGNLSWTLQWLVGFQRLGHDVYLVEKSGYADSCFDPARGVMSDDCSYGTAVVDALLTRSGLQGHWCYVDVADQYHGLTREKVRQLFRTADLFVDIGSHGSWLPEAAETPIKILIDGEPGATQMKMEKKREAGQEPPVYDYYYSNGANVGTDHSPAPTAGKQWRPLFNPVVTDLFEFRPPSPNAPFTTVMNWQAHEPLRFRGVTYGQKDVEFQKFIDLPQRSSVPLEVAVSGQIPREQLLSCGWRIRSAHEVTTSFDSYLAYIYASLGEFSVAKNVYVVTNSGWFSDRSAAYLASGRPVILQATGFETHLPCGRGLFAVRTPDEAAAAIDEVSKDYQRHSRWALEVAKECLDASKILGRLVIELGL